MSVERWVVTRTGRSARVFLKLLKTKGFFPVKEL